MSNDITDQIADLMFKSVPDLCSRLKQQEQELRRVPCTDQSIGRWIDANDLDYLIAVFSMSDEDFAHRFPTEVATTKSERRQLIKQFKQHVHDCAHCSAKQQADQDLDQLIDRTLQENRTELLDRLKEELAGENETRS